MLAAMGRLRGHDRLREDEVLYVKTPGLKGVIDGFIAGINWPGYDLF